MELTRAVTIKIQSQGGPQVRRELDTIGHAGKQAALGVTGAFDKLSMTALRLQGVLALVGAGLSIGGVVNLLADFQRSLSGVEAITRATAAEMAVMSAQARQLGATTQFTAAQAAEGQRLLGQAGFTTVEILKAMPAVLDLAIAGEVDMARAAEVASNVLRGFRLQVEETSRVADVLATAANATNTNIDLLAEGLKYVGPVSTALGVSLETTAAVLGDLSNQGIQGSMAGTSMRRVLSELASPTAAARKEISALGLTVKELNPATNDFVTIIEKLARAGIDADQAFTIFGDRGAPAILALTASAGELQRLNDIMDEAEGSARRMARTMEDNLWGASKALKSALEELILSVGDKGLARALRDVIETVTGVLRAWTGMNDATTESGQRFQDLADKIERVANLLLGLFVGKVVFAAVSGLARLAAAMGAVGSALAGMGTAAAALTMNPLTAAVTAVAAALGVGAGALLVFRDRLGELDGEQVTLGERMSSVWSVIKSQVTSDVGAIIDKLHELDQAMAKAVGLKAEGVTETGMPKLPAHIIPYRWAAQGLAAAGATGAAAGLEQALGVQLLEPPPVLPGSTMRFDMGTPFWRAQPVPQRPTETQYERAIRLRRDEDRILRQKRHAEELMRREESILAPLGVALPEGGVEGRRLMTEYAEIHRSFLAKKVDLQEYLAIVRDLNESLKALNLPPIFDAGDLKGLNDAEKGLFQVRAALSEMMQTQDTMRRRAEDKGEPFVPLLSEEQYRAELKRWEDMVDAARKYQESKAPGAVAQLSEAEKLAGEKASALRLELTKLQEEGAQLAAALGTPEERAEEILRSVAGLSDEMRSKFTKRITELLEGINVSREVNQLREQIREMTGEIAEIELERAGSPEEAAALRLRRGGFAEEAERIERGVPFAGPLRGVEEEVAGVGFGGTFMPLGPALPPGAEAPAEGAAGQIAALAAETYGLREQRKLEEEITQMRGRATDALAQQGPLQLRIAREQEKFNKLADAANVSLEARQLLWEQEYTAILANTEALTLQEEAWAGLQLGVEGYISRVRAASEFGMELQQVFVGVERQITQAFLSGEFTARKFFGTVLEMIQTLAVQQLIAQPIVSAIAGGLGGMFGGSDIKTPIAAAKARRGGVSDAPPEWQMVTCDVFQSAPRLAAGGTTFGLAARIAGDGIPAILHPNEAVVPMTPAGRIPIDVAAGGSLRVPLPGGRSLPAAPLPMSSGTAVGTFQQVFRSPALSGPSTALPVAPVDTPAAERLQGRLWSEFLSTGGWPSAWDPAVADLARSVVRVTGDLAGEPMPGLAYDGLRPAGEITAPVPPWQPDGDAIEDALSRIADRIPLEPSREPDRVSPRAVETRPVAERVLTALTVPRPAAPSETIAPARTVDRIVDRSITSTVLRDAVESRLERQATTDRLEHHATTDRMEVLRDRLERHFAAAEVPRFAWGGMVSGSSGSGALPALLHPPEAIVPLGRELSVPVQIKAVGDNVQARVPLPNGRSLPATVHVQQELRTQFDRAGGWPSTWDPATADLARSVGRLVGSLEPGSAPDQFYSMAGTPTSAPPPQFYPDQGAAAGASLVQVSADTQNNMAVNVIVSGVRDVREWEQSRGRVAASVRSALGGMMR